MTLDESSVDLGTMLQLALQDVHYGTTTDVQGTSAESAVTYYQAMGICELLLDAEVDAFYDQLVRAGLMRRSLLELHASKGGVPDKIRKASKLRGLCGAIASGEWKLARSIAAISESECLDQVEYEDDFLVADFLHRFLKGDAREQLVAVVDALEGILQGEPDPRYDLCRALLARDESMAHDAFEALIETQQQYFGRMAQTSSFAGDPVFVPLSSIYVEGLAWLRLLESQEIHLLEEYAMCPSMARSPRINPFRGPGIPSFST